MFYDGFSDKGQCPAGGGHNAQGINFSLPHGVAANGGAQNNWRYCEKCHAMFFDGYSDKGRCPAGGGHSAQGLMFFLPFRGWGTSVEDLKWMGVPLELLGQVAIAEFTAGFRAGAASQIPDSWAAELSKKIMDDPIGFQLGYSKGVLSGLWAGLKNLFTTIIDLFELSLNLSPIAISFKAVNEAFFLLTDAAHRELRKRQIAEAQAIASAAKATIEDIGRNPGDYIVLSKEIGEALGRTAGRWFTKDFLQKSAMDIGEIIGWIVGQILFEIILQIVIELTTAGVGNAARGGLAVGEGARGGSRVASMIDALKPLLRRVKGLQKFITLLLGEKRAAQAVDAALAGFNTIERKIILEVRAILKSPEILKIRQAAAAGKEAEVTIAGRYIQYEPGMPASGFTNFEANGFALGREAFTSEAEFVKTLLHEIFRLETSNIGKGVVEGASMQARVAQETQAAANFADRAFTAAMSQ
jgi:hypothetical protein